MSAEPDIKPPRPIPGMEKPAPDWEDRLSRLYARSRRLHTATSSAAIVGEKFRGEGNRRDGHTDSY